MAICKAAALALSQNSASVTGVRLQLVSPDLGQMKRARPIGLVGAAGRLWRWRNVATGARTNKTAELCGRPGFDGPRVGIRDAALRRSW